MKTLALISLSLAVALGMPRFAPGVLQIPVLNEEHQSPLLRDLRPMQGHVVVDDPVPQVRLGSEEQQKEVAPVAVDMLSQNIVELELKVKPEIGVEHEGEVKTEVKKEQELKGEAEVRPEPEVKVESKGNLGEGNVQPEVMAELQVNVNSDNDLGHELQDNPEGKVETEVKVGVVTHVEPGVKLNPEDIAERDVNEKPEVEMEPEPAGYPDFKVESEVEVDKNVLEHEMESTSKEQQDVEEKFQVQMNLEAEFSERHIDMEGKNEMSGGPMKELEPLVDDYLFADELTNMEVEKSLSEAPEKEGLLSGSHEEPIVEMTQENLVPDAVFMDEGPALDFMGQPIPSVEEYFPNEEARIGMEPVEQSDSMVEAMSLLVQEEELLSPMVGMRPFEVPAMEATGRCHCTGLLFEGKCYISHQGPLNASDAEFACQGTYTGAHLASITSRHLQVELAYSLLRQNQYGVFSSPWIGGLRYLKTGRFIWLDGTHWDYDDWLPGNPNNTSDAEECVEVVTISHAQFRNARCSNLRSSFVCSYPCQ